MIRAATLALALFVLPTSTALAQQASQTPTLSLSATGGVTLNPDQATVSVGVVSRGDTAAIALRSNASTMNDLYRELGRAGVERTDIQTSQLSVSPVYSRVTSTQERRVVGYEARNTVSALVRDVDDVGDVVDALFEAGANTLNGVNFSSSEAEDARDQARRVAMANLMARRDLYAEAGGFEIIRLLSVQENSYAAPFSNRLEFESSFVAAPAAAGPTPVSAGELTITVVVNASWEIEG